MAETTGVDGLRARVDAVLSSRYHHAHPFHRRMHAGELGDDEVRDWVLNRFYYQRMMPVKDALVLAKLPSREARRAWIGRIVDQDGDGRGDEGGLEAWLRLADAVGLDRAAVADDTRVAPAVRFAVDAYVNFCRLASWQECVAATLTQLAVPDLMRERVAALRRHHPWIAAEGLVYFERHQKVAAVESDQAMALLAGALRTGEQVDRAVAAVEFKCDVLWAVLDAIDAIR